jgi:hypothetical protein
MSSQISLTLWLTPNFRGVKVGRKTHTVLVLTQPEPNQCATPRVCRVPTCSSEQAMKRWVDKSRGVRRTCMGFPIFWRVHPSRCLMRLQVLGRAFPIISGSWLATTVQCCPCCPPRCFSCTWTLIERYQHNAALVGTIRFNGRHPPNSLSRRSP